MSSIDNLTVPTDDLKNQAKEALRKAGDQFSEQTNQLRDLATDARYNSQEYIQNNPWSSVFVAAAMGFLSPAGSLFVRYPHGGGHRLARGPKADRAAPPAASRLVCYFGRRDGSHHPGILGPRHGPVAIARATATNFPPTALTNGARPPGCRARVPPSPY
jgi:ElaB/YqjD/DUF883 family membrane-anchored ribosome-binding protein